MSEYFRHFILPRRSQIGLFHLPFPLLIINLANVFHRSVLAEVSPSVRGLRPSVPPCAPWTRDRRRSHSEEFITLVGDRPRRASHPPIPVHPMCCSVASRVRGSSSSSAPPAAMLLTVSPRKKVKAIPAAGRRARERASENGSGGGGYGSARPSMVCLAPGVARSL